MKKPAVGSIVQARCGRMTIVRRVEFYYTHIEYLDERPHNKGAFRHAEFWNYFRRAA